MPANFCSLAFNPDFYHSHCRIKCVISITEKNKQNDKLQDLNEWSIRKSLLITGYDLLRTPDSVWTCSWWGNRWSPVGFPARPGSGHQSARQQFVEVLIHDVPEVTDWIQVWGSEWHVNSMSIQDRQLYHALRVPSSVSKEVWHVPVTPDEHLEMNSSLLKQNLLKKWTLTTSISCQRRVWVWSLTLVGQ